MTTMAPAKKKTKTKVPKAICLRHDRNQVKKRCTCGKARRYRPGRGYSRAEHDGDAHRAEAVRGETRQRWAALRSLGDAADADGDAVLAPRTARKACVLDSSDADAAKPLSSKAGLVKKPTATEKMFRKKQTTIAGAEARLKWGLEVHLNALKLKVLCAALALQRSEPSRARWRGALIMVNNASKIDVVEAAIAGGIPKTRISCQSGDLDVLQRAAELLGKDRVMCKSAHLEVLTVAVALLGKDRVRGVSSKPEVLMKAAELLGADRITDTATRKAQTRTAAAAQKALADDPALHGLVVHVSSTVELMKVRAIKDLRLVRINVRVSTAEDARKVVAMRLFDRRVGRVAVGTSRAAEAAEALKMAGVDYVFLNDARPSEIAAAAALPGIGRLGCLTSTVEGANTAIADGATYLAVKSANVEVVVAAATMPGVDYSAVRTVRPQIALKADRLGLNIHLLDGEAQRAAGRRLRAVWRAELAAASIAGVLDIRTPWERFIAAVRQVRDLIRPLKEFFDTYQDGDVRARQVIEVGIGADDRVFLPGRVLPRFPETIAWSDRPESVLARQAGGRFGKTRWGHLVRRGAARIYVSRADVNHGVTELVEDLLQGYVRRRLPEVAGVTSANGDGAFGGAGGSGRRARASSSSSSTSCAPSRSLASSCLSSRGCRSRRPARAPRWPARSPSSEW